MGEIRTPSDPAPNLGRPQEWSPTEGVGRPESALADAVRRTAAEAMASSRLKGMAVGIARGGEPAEALCIGVDAAGRAVTGESLFPVASVTKLATALAVLRLVDAGALGLDDPLAFHVPEAVAAAQLGVTLRRLLSHTAGLPLDVPSELAPYAPGLNWPTLAAACLQAQLERLPATRVQYSNVGYGLLAIVAERHTARDFPAALASLVLDPLGIEGYLGAKPPRPPVTLSGIRSKHVRTPLEPFNSAFWRSLALPWGGLLTTVDGALGLVRAFRGVPRGFLRPETAAEAIRNQAGKLGGGMGKPLLWAYCPWGLGPELRDAKSPTWTPPEASPDSFGHAGSSGSLVWADPEADVAWAILGTRTADSGWLIQRGPRIAAAILHPSP